MRKLLEQNQHLTYLHTHVLTPELLKKCGKNNIIVEADIAFDEDRDEVFIGHPKKYYTDVIQKPLPDTISFEELSQYLISNPQTHLVFDCKDKRVFPALRDLVNKVGSERLMFTGFVKEWAEPYPPGAKIEAHWDVENIELEAIKGFQAETNTSWLGWIRGFNKDWVRTQDLTTKALNTAGETFTGFGFVFSFKPTRTQRSELEKISNAGYLPVIPIDLYLRKPPFPFIGLTQFRFRATRLNTLRPACAEASSGRQGLGQA